MYPVLPSELGNGVGQPVYDTLTFLDERAFLVEQVGTVHCRGRLPSQRPEPEEFLGGGSDFGPDHQRTLGTVHRLEGDRISTLAVRQFDVQSTPSSPRRGSPCGDQASCRDDDRLPAFRSRFGTSRRCETRQETTPHWPPTRVSNRRRDRRTSTPTGQERHIGSKAEHGPPLTSAARSAQRERIQGPRAPQSIRSRPQGRIQPAIPLQLRTKRTGPLRPVRTVLGQSLGKIQDDEHCVKSRDSRETPASAHDQHSDSPRLVRSGTSTMDQPAFARYDSAGRSHCSADCDVSAHRPAPPRSVGEAN